MSMMLRLPLFAALLCAAPFAAASAAELRLTVSGLKPKGQLLVQLFDAESRWKTEADAVREIKLPVSATRAEVRIEDLPAGVYGAMIFQDLDGNGKMSFNLIGWPLEPFGFSNNSRGLLGPPAWSRAAFRVDGEAAAHTIRVQ